MSKLELLLITFFLLFSTIARTVTFAERNLPLTTQNAHLPALVAVADATTPFEHISPMTRSRADATAKRGATAMAKLFFELQQTPAPIPVAKMALFLSHNQLPASHIMPTPSRPPAA